MTRALAERFARLLGEHMTVVALVDEMNDGWRWACSCGEQSGGLSLSVYASADARRHLADVLASLSDERLAQAEAKVERVEALLARETAAYFERGPSGALVILAEDIEAALSDDAAPRTTQPREKTMSNALLDMLEQHPETMNPTQNFAAMNYDPGSCGSTYRHKVHTWHDDDRDGVVRYCRGCSADADTPNYPPKP